MRTAIIVVVALLVGLVVFTELLLLIFRARRLRSPWPEGQWPRSQWVVDHAGTFEELERRLNHLDEQGFQVYGLYVMPRDSEAGAVFVLVAFQPFGLRSSQPPMSAS